MPFNFFEGPERLGSRDDLDVNRRKALYLKCFGVYDHALMTRNHWRLFCLFVCQGVYDALVCILGMAVVGVLVVQVSVYVFEIPVDVQAFLHKAQLFLSRLRPYFHGIQ